MPEKPLYNRLIPRRARAKLCLFALLNSVTCGCKKTSRKIFHCCSLSGKEDTLKGPTSANGIIIVLLKTFTMYR